MKKSLRFSALIGLIAFLSWLPASTPAEAQQTCESMNNASCSNRQLGDSEPCQSLAWGQTLTCYCFNHNGNRIWSCPVSAGPRSADLDSCANPAPSLAAIGTFPAPYCGDRCETEGEGRGCREITAGGTRRTPCTCRNGVWTC